MKKYTMYKGGGDDDVKQPEGGEVKEEAVAE
jgi:hypothetical protein